MAFILRSKQVKNSSSIEELRNGAFEIRNNQSLANEINFLWSHTTLAKEPRRETAFHHKTRTTVYTFFVQLSSPAFL